MAEISICVTRKGNLGHYYFSIAVLLRGQNQPVDQVTVAALLIYNGLCSISVQLFRAQSSQILRYISLFNINGKLVATNTGVNMNVEYFVSNH